MEQLITAIDICIKNKLILPAMILIYSGIDMAGWLDSIAPDANVKDTFISWVDRYVLTSSEQLECTAIDLYAARCGLTHRLNPDSRLSETGKARIIAYTSGKKTDIIKNAIKIDGKSSEYVAVHIDDLFKAYIKGLETFFRDAEKDPSRKALVTQKAERYYNSPVDTSNIASVSFK